MATRLELQQRSLSAVLRSSSAPSSRLVVVRTPSKTQLLANHSSLQAHIVLLLYFKSILLKENQSYEFRIKLRFSVTI